MSSSEGLSPLSSVMEARPRPVFCRRIKRQVLLSRQVLSVIREHGPITARAIADRIPILTTDAERVVRKQVRDLVMAHEPIASRLSAPAGYFIITDDDPEARDAYVAQLRNRIERTAQRLARFRGSTASRLQQVLFEDLGPSEGGKRGLYRAPSAPGDCPRVSAHPSHKSYPSDSPSKEAKCQE